MKNDFYLFAFGFWMTGFALVGQRILAPYFGTYYFVWFSLMGSILCAISAGCIAGVFFRERNPKLYRISLSLFFAGFYVILLPFLKDFIISFSIKLGIKWGSAMASLLLFSPPSFVFGLITPSFMQSRYSSSEEFGNTAAKLLALFLLGQFAGFLIVAYFLIPHLPNTTILFILGALMMIDSLLIFFDKIRMISTALFIVLALFFRTQSPFLHDTDSLYQHILITSGTDPKSGVSMRKLFLGNYMHACKVVNSNQPCSILDELYAMDILFVPNIEKALVIGEGSFVIAQNLLERNPRVKIKLVEMDRAVATAARQFFDLRISPQLKIYYQDGRTFLNNNHDKFDVIYLDIASPSPLVKSHYATLENFEKIAQSLSENGLVIVNLLSRFQGPGSDLFYAEIKGLKTLFPQLYIFTGSVSNNAHLTARQNILLFASKNARRYTQYELLQKASAGQMDLLLNHFYNAQITIPPHIRLFTDNYSPCESCVNRLF